MSAELKNCLGKDRNKYMAESKKLKIGILTFHYAQNYGAVLQCYALQRSLENCFPKAEVSVVDYKNQKIVYGYAIFHLKNKNFYRKIRSLIGGILYLPQRIKCKSNFKTFVRKNLNIGSSDFPDYDAIFYGSDQIWNPDITGGTDKVYFGDGFNGTKIAYAASDGNKLKVADETKNLLKKFPLVTVREKSSVKKFSFLKNVRSVCDPVLLLSKTEWIKSAVVPKEKNYVFAYKIGENLDFDDEAEKLGRMLGKKVIQAVYVKPLKKLFYKKQKFVQGVSPLEFVGFIANADFVVTTSFHGTAFSVILEKPFFTLQIGSYSERITDLLKNVGLEKRYVKNIPEKFERGIYTDEVKEKIAELRKTGTDFIENSKERIFQNVGAKK